MDIGKLYSIMIEDCAKPGEEVQELIRESKADGMYETMMEDIEKDIYRSIHIECIGIRKV